MTHAAGVGEGTAGRPEEAARSPRDRPGLTARVGLLAASLALDAIWLVTLPVWLLALLIVSRGLTRPKFRRGALGKLAGFPRLSGNGPVLWIHAVSVGEVNVAEPLVRLLRERLPGHRIALSVGTYTGRENARRRFPGLPVFWAPFDLTPCVALAMRRIRPIALVLVELELWPNLLLTARRKGVPVVVANGRLTERSARRYGRLGPLGRGLFRLVGAWAVQDDAYAQRVRSLGVEAGRIEVLGNLKFDRGPGPGAAQGNATRESLGWGNGSGTVVLVAGCTHPGEEALLASLLPRWRAAAPGLRLVLAPRHVERLRHGEIERWGVPGAVRRWSEVQERDAAVGDAVLVVDRVGELERFYAAADIVFVGGSLVPHGGHNLLEPARLGRPVLFGPHHGNFQREAEALLEADAARRVDDSAALEHELGTLLGDPSRRTELGRRARETTERLGGASERHLAWLARRLRLPLLGETC